MRYHHRVFMLHMCYLLILIFIFIKSCNLHVVFVSYDNFTLFLQFTVRVPKVL